VRLKFRVKSVQNSYVQFHSEPLPTMIATVQNIIAISHFTKGPTVKKIK